LTGNWFGARDALAANGVTFDISSTQFYQGVASGGLSDVFQYAGRNDYYVNVVGEKAGLWKGLFLDLHGETRYGNTINGDTGALMPANVGALFPLPTGTVTALTGVKATQALSENLMVFGGKMNMFDVLLQPYGGGRGVDAFMNIGLTLPVALARTIPYSTLGGGFAVLDKMHPIFSFLILDTHNTPTTSGFENLFSNGAVMLAQATLPVDLFGLPGHQGVGGSYSTGTYSDLTPTAYFDPNVGLVVLAGSVVDSWAVYYSADQALYVDPNNAKRSWGLFTNIGVADNGPSPVRVSAAVGLGGSSPLVSRPLDTFGIGYSFVDYSSPVINLAPRLLPIQPDNAVELYYNIAVTPWFHLTPDLQVLVPARERTLPPNAQGIDTAVVVGIRAKIDF
jgi:porin